MKNWFVIYPPGGGGNHLANLLSLNNGFEQRFKLEDYGNNKQNAHSSLFSHVDIENIETNLEYLKKTSNVFCGHLIQYHRFKIDKIAENFPDRSFFLIQFPQYDTTGYRRIEQHNGAELPRWLYSETALLYNETVFREVCNEHEENNVYNIDPNKLFSPDITELFNELDEIYKIDFKIDMALAQDLHTKWLNKI
jgi:hypothetical protein